MKPNRELIICPCCGSIICARCELYQERLNAQTDDQAYLNRTAKAYQKHHTEVDHSGLWMKNEN